MLKCQLPPPLVFFEKLEEVLDIENKKEIDDTEYVGFSNETKKYYYLGKQENLDMNFQNENYNRNFYNQNNIYFQHNDVNKNNYTFYKIIGRLKQNPEGILPDKNVLWNGNNCKFVNLYKENPIEYSLQCNNRVYHVNAYGKDVDTELYKEFYNAKQLGKPKTTLQKGYTALTTSLFGKKGGKTKRNKTRKTKKTRKHKKSRR